MKRRTAEKTKLKTEGNLPGARGPPEPFVGCRLTIVHDALPIKRRRDSSHEALVRPVQLLKGGEFRLVRMTVGVPHRWRRAISAVRRLHARCGHVVSDAGLLQLWVMRRDHGVHAIRAVCESVMFVLLGVRVLAAS